MNENLDELIPIHSNLMQEILQKPHRMDGRGRVVESCLSAEGYAPMSLGTLAAMHMTRTGRCTIETAWRLASEAEWRQHLSQDKKDHNQSFVERCRFYCNDYLDLSEVAFHRQLVRRDSPFGQALRHAALNPFDWGVLAVRHPRAGFVAFWADNLAHPLEQPWFARDTRFSTDYVEAACVNAAHRFFLGRREQHKLIQMLAPLRPH